MPHLIEQKPSCHKGQTVGIRLRALGPRQFAVCQVVVLYKELQEGRNLSHVLVGAT